MRFGRSVGPRPAPAGIVTRVGRRIVLATVVGLAAGVGARVHAAPDPSTVRAAIVLNLAKFVDWDLELVGESMDFCIVGDEEFAAVFDGSASGRSVRGKDVLTRALPTGGEVAGCDVLYLGVVELAPARRAMADTLGGQTLIIGSQSGFLDAGGTVNLVVKHGRLGFELNMASAADHRVRLSGKLRALAIRVIHRQVGAAP